MSQAQATLGEFEPIEGTEPETMPEGARERMLKKARDTGRMVFWSAFDREDYACPICGSDGPFEVHHRDGDALNNHLVNLIGICHLCHSAEHRRRKRLETLDNWKDGFAEALGVDR